MGKLDKICMLILISTTLMVQPSVQQLSLGNLSSCGHDLEGEVVATSKKQIIIKGFKYDGKGPGSYFTAMKKGAKKVQPNADMDDIVIIPYKGAEAPATPCDVISWQKAIDGKDIQLDLPDEISMYETIGVYCHQYCNNFGHIVIKGNLSSLPNATANYTAPPDCAPLTSHFKHAAEKNLNCTEDKNAKNVKLDACDPPKRPAQPHSKPPTDIHTMLIETESTTANSLENGSGADHFQPIMFMATLGIVFINVPV
ncbi:Protein Skeletor, isoforms B/C [Orchesella cincta]|uniref:Protein Skeletor, isoforms B/C n=1 Tax=Orchesella cincta TaxID=48709 RepID=A0A1D2MWE4_ORCCI|nr:Protein Skeletor, isoforms B/C [Orchesella cincta]